MRYLIYIAVTLMVSTSFSQENSQKFNRTKWKELKGKLKYKKSPSNPFDREFESSDDGDSYRFDPDDYGSGGGSGGSGSRDSRRAQERESDSGFSGGGSWAMPLMIIMGVLLVAFLAYFIFFKNKAEPKIVNTEFDDEVEEYDIHTIQKSDLEIALEKALAQEDYRKCIRIYFTFILKELSTNGLIDWEKEKTNYDYLRDLQDKPEYHGFRNAMEVFEIIWYGKRKVSKEIYLQLEPDFKNYLKQISSE